MDTTSYYSFTQSEKQMIGKMLQLSFSKYEYLEQELNALLDTCKMCEEHQLPYQFYDDNQFYCPKCLTTKKPNNFHYIEDYDDTSIKKLDQELSKYQKKEIPAIDLEERAISIRKKFNDSINYADVIDMYNSNQKQSSNQESLIQLQQQNQDFQISQCDDEQKNLNDILKKRTKFLEVQEFISHISIEKSNRKIHDEMHITDDKMRPILQLGNNQRDKKDFDTIVEQFLKKQQ